MSDQADQPSDDRVKPWTIKGVIPEVRNGAIAAAERARQPIGEWVSRAIRGQVQADRQENRAPVPVGPGSAPTADLVELERLVALTASLSSAGAPPPKAVSRSAYGLIRQRLAGMKGPTEPRSGPTKKAVSQTGELFSQTTSGFGPTEEASSPTKKASGPTGAPKGPSDTPGGKGRKVRR